MQTGRMTDVNGPDHRDPRGLRTDALLLDAWLRFTGEVEAGQVMPMSVPGHKQRQDLVGTVVAGDAPLDGGLDTMKHADTLRAEAEGRAARLWGADWCRFSVAGRCTHGNQALALAVGKPGQYAVVSCTLHRSMLLGLVLAGLRPVWVRPEVDPASGLPAAVAVETVRAALAAYPGACGLLLGDPSYVGTISDIAGHAEVAHEAGVPLVVDAAWAAHLGFHPDLPPHALTAGADAMVTSAHKALPAYTQGALVLARTERLDAARLDRAFEATHTTSPTGSIMASIDAARALLERDGKELCARLLSCVAAARQRLREVPGLDVLDGPGVEPTKLVVLLAGNCRCARPRDRGGPDRGRDASRDGRPRHDGADRDGGRRRRHRRGVHGEAHRGDRAASGPAPARAGGRGSLDGRAGNGHGAQGRVLRAERDRQRRPGRPGSARS